MEGLLSWSVRVLFFCLDKMENAFDPYSNIISNRLTRRKLWTDTRIQTCQLFLLFLSWLLPAKIWFSHLQVYCFYWNILELHVVKLIKDVFFIDWNGVQFRFFVNQQFYLLNLREPFFIVIAPNLNVFTRLFFLQSWKLIFFYWFRLLLLQNCSAFSWSAQKSSVVYSLFCWLVNFVKFVADVALTLYWFWFLSV